MVFCLCLFYWSSELLWLWFHPKIRNILAIIAFTFIFSYSFSYFQKPWRANAISHFAITSLYIFFGFPNSFFSSFFEKDLILKPSLPLTLSFCCWACLVLWFVCFLILNACYVHNLTASAVLLRWAALALSQSS